MSINLQEIINKLIKNGEERAAAGVVNEYF